LTQAYDLRRMFDPRTVPVIGIDDHLPAVALDELRPEALRRRFAMPPQWQPEVREEARFTDREPRQAAVLVPIVTGPRPTLLLTERTAHLSSHAGQVAFPGGKVDDTDADARAAALRETHEEIGLTPERVEVIGYLPEYLTGTAYAVTPVVGLVQSGFSLQPNSHEVAQVFEVPLEFLMNPANHRRHALWWEGHKRHWFSMPYHQGDAEHFIWGATAGMLRNLYRFLRA
jgi:8-oxo-dGTP pyrophosphatase MutT (NUDIX family)